MLKHLLALLGFVLISFPIIHDGFSEETKAAAKTVSLEDLKLTPAELPKGLEFAKKEGHCISIQASTFYQMPEQFGLLPKPATKGRQSIQGPDGPGEVLYFYYGRPVPSGVTAYLPNLIWGGPRRSEMHPEQIIKSGRFLVILSFPMGSGACDKLMEKVMAKLKALEPLCKDAPEVEQGVASGDPVVKEAMEAYQAQDNDKGLAILHRDEAKLEKSSVLQYFLGEFSLGKQDWPSAEKGYAKALELNTSTDMLPGGDNLVYASQDGLAAAVAMQGRVKESVALFEKALVLAKKINDTHSIADTEYNLACSYAETGRFEDACKTLKHSLSLEPERKENARKDSSFQKALERKDFQGLLK